MRTLLALFAMCFIVPLATAQNGTSPQSIPLVTTGQDSEEMLPKSEYLAKQTDDEKVKELEQELDRIKRENAKDRTFYLFNKLHWGETAGMELAVATQSRVRHLWFNLGLQSPRLWDIFSISASIDLYSQRTYDDYANPLQDVSRWRIGGTAKLTVSSPLLFSYMRLYASTGIILNAAPYSYSGKPVTLDGVTFTPTESLQQTEWCFAFGFELYFSESIATFFEFGSNSGSHFGLRLYLPR